VSVSKANLGDPEPDFNVTIFWPTIQTVDAIRGDLVQLRLATNYTPSVQPCLANNNTTASLPEPLPVGPGGAFYYLLRPVMPQGCSQSATYSSQGPGERPGRDPQINQSQNACP
jgi:hypothetical protein